MLQSVGLQRVGHYWETEQQEGKKRGFEEDREVSAAILHHFVVRLEIETLII